MGEGQGNPRNPSGIASRFADVNGVRLHYVEAGAGTLTEMKKTL